MTEDQQQQLSALLRLKRFEQPPPGYFDGLLQDVHRRQRADLLRRPAWKLALERVQTFFGEHSMGYGSYAGAMAAVMILGVTILAISLPHKQSAGSSPVLVAKAEPVNLRSERAADSVLSLQDAPIVVASASDVDSSMSNARLFPSTIARGPAAGRQPRYVIDAIPVSYDATKVSFDF